MNALARKRPTFGRQGCWGLSSSKSNGDWHPGRSGSHYECCQFSMYWFLDWRWASKFWWICKVRLLSQHDVGRLPWGYRSLLPLTGPLGNHFVELLVLRRRRVNNVIGLRMLTCDVHLFYFGISCLCCITLHGVKIFLFLQSVFPIFWGFPLLLYCYSF